MGKVGTGKRADRGGDDDDEAGGVVGLSAGCGAGGGEQKVGERNTGADRGCFVTPPWHTPRRVLGK